MQGRGSWKASCMYVYVCVYMSVSTSLWASVTLCNCVCLRLGSRLLPEVEFHRPAVSLQLQSDRTATPSAELQKVFSSLLLTAFVHLPSFSFFSLFHGYSWNGNKQLWKCIPLHLGILGWSRAGPIQFQTTLNMNQCFSNLKQLQNGSS